MTDNEATMNVPAALVPTIAGGWVPAACMSVGEAFAVGIIETGDEPMTEAEFKDYIEKSWDWAIGGERPGSLAQWAAFVGAIAQQAVLERDMAELDRLRAAVQAAPHADGCAARIPMHFHESWPCDCWKARA